MPELIDRPCFLDLLRLAAAMRAEDYETVVAHYASRIAELAYFLMLSFEALLIDHRHLACQLLGRFTGPHAEHVQSALGPCSESILGLVNEARAWVQKARLQHVPVLVPKLDSGLFPSIKARFVPDAEDALDSVLLEDCLVVAYPDAIASFSAGGRELSRVFLCDQSSKARISPHGRFVAISNGVIGRLIDCRTGLALHHVPPVLGCFSPDDESYACYLGTTALVLTVATGVLKQVHDFGPELARCELDWGAHLVLACGGTAVVMSQNLTRINYEVNLRLYYNGGNNIFEAVGASPVDDRFVGLITDQVDLYYAAEVTDGDVNCIGNLDGDWPDPSVRWVTLGERSLFQALPGCDMFDGVAMERLTSVDGRVTGWDDNGLWLVYNDQELHGNAYFDEGFTTAGATAVQPIDNLDPTDRCFRFYNLETMHTWEISSSFACEGRCHLSPDGSMLATENRILRVAQEMPSIFQFQSPPLQEANRRQVAWTSKNSVVFRTHNAVFALDRVGTTWKETPLEKFDVEPALDFVTVRSVIEAGTGFGVNNLGFAEIFSKVSSFLGPMHMHSSDMSDIGYVSLGPDSVGFMLERERDKPLRCFPTSRGLLMLVPTQLEDTLGLLEVQF